MALGLEEHQGPQTVTLVARDHLSGKPTPSLRRQLMENQISTVERGAFDDMKELERL